MKTVERRPFIFLHVLTVILMSSSIAGIMRKGLLKTWSSWEKVDLDITAENVVPAVFHKKLYLFWPVIEKKEVAVPNKNRKKDEPELKRERWWGSKTRVE